MTIKTWTASQFSKRRNSTKQPGATPAPASHTVVLKDPTSLINPTVIFNGHMTPSDVVYARIDDFGRYYFVGEIRYNGPHTEIDLISDPMASFKSDIGSVDGHVLRCATAAYQDPTYTDPFNPPSTDVDFYHASEGITIYNESVFGANYESYILTVMSGNSGNGFATSYKMDYATLKNIADLFCTPGFFQNLLQEFTNPLESIIDLKVMPISPSANFWTGTSEHVKIGSQDTGYSALKLTTVQFPKGYTITLPSYGTGYLKAPPYVTFSLYLPFVGSVAVDYQNVRSGKLYYDVFLDLKLGDIIYELKDDDGMTITSYSGNFASELPVTAQSFSSMGIIGGLATVVGGAAAAIATVATGGTALAAVGGLGAVAGGIGATAASCEQHGQMNGKVSSSLARKGMLDVQLTIIQKQAQGIYVHETTEGVISHKQVQAAFMTGYIQYLNSHVQGAMTEGERETIDAYLNSGFFYE